MGARRKLKPVTDEEVSRVMRDLRARPRSPDANPGGRPSFVQKCPKCRKVELGVVAMWRDHLANDCPKNQGKRRILQEEWFAMAKEARARQRLKYQQAVA